MPRRMQRLPSSRHPAALKAVPPARPQMQMCLKPRERTTPLRRFRRGQGMTQLTQRSRPERGQSILRTAGPSRGMTAAPCLKETKTPRQQGTSAAMAITLLLSTRRSCQTRPGTDHTEGTGAQQQQRETVA